MVRMYQGILSNSGHAGVGAGISDWPLLRVECREAEAESEAEGEGSWEVDGWK
jgi:hypothetical protein